MCVRNNYLYHILFFILLQLWVHAYRQGRLLVNCNTNNGVERQNENFKYDYLRHHKKATLTDMLTILIDNYLSDKWDR